MIEIPLTQDPEQKFSITLNGRLYRFRVLYNTRAEFWSFDLSDSTGDLVFGVPIVGGIDLLEAFNFGIQNLFAIDLSDKSADATFDTLGDEVKLVLFEDAELA